MLCVSVSVAGIIFPFSAIKKGIFRSALPKFRKGIINYIINVLMFQKFMTPENIGVCITQVGDDKDVLAGEAEGTQTWEG